VAFDVGTARVGIAVSDIHAILASPVDKIDRIDSNAVIQAKQVLEENEAIEAYVGLPVNLKSKNTKSTLNAIDFARGLQELVNIEVRLVDERFSTKVASESLRASGKDSKAQRQYIDSAAAAVILESALEHERRTGQSAGLLVSEVDADE
jgi:putative Holliday junction resolvase